MLQSHHRLFHGFLWACDLALVGAVALTTVRDPGSDDGVVQLGGLALAWIAASARTGLYRSRRTETMWREVRCLAESALVTVALASLLAAALHGRLVFAPVTSVLGIALVLTVQRATLRHVLRRLRVRGRNYRRVLIVGGGRSAGAIAARLDARPHYGIRVLGIVPLTGAPDERVAGLRALGQARDLPRILAVHAVDRVALCPPANARTHDIERVFRLCDEAGIACHYAPHWLSLRNLTPAVAWYGDVPTFAFEHQVRPAWMFAWKRALDVAVAAVLLIVLLPALLAVALWIKLADGGPVLFAQQRVGSRGRTFRCLKFRTMCVDAEARRAALAGLNERDGPVFKIARDPRVTPFGAFLRKYSIDELPQLWNVLRGEMSLVGPRPPIPSEVERYAWWQRRRIAVRPGLTCIWQIRGRNRASFTQWMEMDMYYIDHWSPWMDVKIMLGTVGTVLRGTGA